MEEEGWTHQEESTLQDLESCLSLDQLVSWYILVDPVCQM